ncbi:unnamed protein product [Parnassius apollo]|uniref:(apollo) hypothetical protein n=1 Tax=Parnassius apollo TaxID=110799 RepID=A0A8S3W2P4_PARAO|nr:unnamed protein product [Parnassius apollo]
MGNDHDYDIIALLSLLDDGNNTILTSESDSEVSWPEEMENDILIEREKPEESESPQSELQILGNLNSQASTSESGNQPDKVPEVQDLDAEALAVLGEINIEQEKGPPLHPEIANRWTPILSKGLKKGRQERAYAKIYAIRKCATFNSTNFEP